MCSAAIYIVLLIKNIKKETFRCRAKFPYLHWNKTNGKKSLNLLIKSSNKIKLFRYSSVNVTHNITHTKATKSSTTTTTNHRKTIKKSVFTFSPALYVHFLGSRKPLHVYKLAPFFVWLSNNMSHFVDTFQDNWDLKNNN